MCIYVQVFLLTPKIFQSGKFFTKNYQFWGHKATFLSYSGEIWHEGAVLGLSQFTQAKYCKNRLRGYTPFGKIYTKNTNFGNFVGCTPTFFNHSDKIWHEGANLGLPPQAKFRFRGYTPFGQIYTKNYQFQRFWGCKPTFEE